MLIRLAPKNFRLKLAYCYIRAAPGLLHPVISRAEFPGARTLTGPAIKKGREEKAYAWFKSQREGGPGPRQRKPRLIVSWICFHSQHSGVPLPSPQSQQDLAECVVLIYPEQAREGGQRTRMDLEIQTVRGVFSIARWERSPCLTQSSDYS